VVHQSLNNHPHNLIYLCPTCHDKYDNKHLITRDEISGIKKEVLRVRMSIWRSQAGLLKSVYSLISVLRNLSENISSNSFAILSELENDLFVEIKEKLNLKQLEGVEAVSKRLPVKPTDDFSEEELFDASEKALEDSGAAECPLCEGSGSHNNWNCPICEGAGTVDAQCIEDIDLSDFKQVECPLCEGSGSHKDYDCPVCQGARTIDARDIGELDLSQYDET